MPLWGTTHDSAANKPKWAPVDEDSDNRRGDIYASNAGWVQQAGTAASGNNNADADPEVLVAIGMLAGTDASTGLKAPTLTGVTFVGAPYAAGTVTATVDVAWDEGVTVAGTPTLAVSCPPGKGGGPHTLVYTATGSTASRKRFTLAGITFAEGDELHVGINNIDVVGSGGTISDTIAGGTAVAAQVGFSHLNGGATFVTIVTA